MSEQLSVQMNVCQLFNLAVRFMEAPCILYMDSISSNSMNTLLCQNICNFLSYEWSVSRIGTAPFHTFTWHHALLPQQVNNVDCGIYCLQYIQLFLVCKPASKQQLQDYGSLLLGNIQGNQFRRDTKYVILSLLYCNKL